MTAFRIPWFSAPIGMVGLVHRGARQAGRSDLSLFGAPGWRAAAWVVALGVPLAVMFSPWVDDVYTESIVFLVVAIGVGAAVPTLGTLLVIVFVPIDLIVYLTQAGGANLLSVGGRALTWWMLWLVVVELPILSRQTTWLAVRREAPRLGLATGAVGLALAVYAWAQAMPYLLRPMYVAQDFVSNPSVDAVAPLQQWGWIPAIAAAAAFVAVRPDRRPESPARRLEPRSHPERAEGPRWRGLIGYLPGIILIGMMMLGLAENVVQYLVLPVAFLAAVATARYAGGSGWLARWIGRIPILIRLLIGLVLVTLIGVVLAGGQSIGADFSLYIFTAAIGMVVFAALLAPENMRTDAASIAIVVGVVGWLLLAVSTPALADNCSGGSDCNNSALATGTGAAVGSGLAAVEAVRAAKQGKLKEFATDQAKGDLGDPGKEYEKLVDEADKTGEEAGGFFEWLKRVWNSANDSLQGDTGDSPDAGGQGTPDPPSDWPGNDPPPQLPDWED